MIMDKINSLIHSGTEVPELVKITKNNINRIIVPIIIKETIENNQKLYSWLELPILEQDYNYETVIDTMINIKYNLSEVLAIINNYMLDSKNEKYKKEFEDLQEWRLIVKNSVKKHFNII